MKFVKSKFFIIVLCVAVVLVLVPAVLAAFGQTDILRSGLATAAKPFEWVASKAADAVGGFVAVFSDYDELQKENESLRAELEAIEDQMAENEVLKEQNEWLKKFLDVKTSKPELEFADAAVISHEAGNYATVITLNKGSVHGIKKGMPVITPDGVLGSVSETGLDWCKVTSIIESDSRVGVYTERTMDSGTLEGDPSLRAEGKCLISYDTSADIHVGDKVYTSGGTLYPNGLYVGSITEISADETTRRLIATVDTGVDFSELSSLTGVMIVRGYSGSIRG